MDVSAQQQRGWTLVELMVGTAVGLLILAGIFQIYTAAKHSYDVQTRIAEIQDVGRFAIDLLSQDIRQAGYWGLLNINLAGSDGVLVGAVNTETCASTDTNWGRVVVNKIFGLNDTSAGYGCIGTDRLRGDILTVRYADPVAIPSAGSFTPTRLYIRTAPFQGAIAQGQPQNVTDPRNSDHALVAHAYFVAGSGTTVSCGGNSVMPPALARKILSSNGTPLKQSLVNGVEHLQFQYGVDTDTAGRVVRYVDANNVANWRQVVAVRIWVLVRATCPESGYINTGTYSLGDQAYSPNDSYRRALFTTTVALRNCVDTYAPLPPVTLPTPQTQCQ